MLFTEPLKQNHVFRKLYARGKNAVGPFLVVYAMRNGTGQNRLGVTASTKLGHAVKRDDKGKVIYTETTPASCGVEGVNKVDVLISGRALPLMELPCGAQTKTRFAASRP